MHDSGYLYYLHYESNRTQRWREANYERLARLAQDAARPTSQRSVLARLAQYVGLFLVV
jgi:hypothetical protein